MMTPTEARNVAEMRETIGSGPVRETAASGKKKGQAVGERERAMREWREAQEQPASTQNRVRTDRT